MRCASVPVSQAAAPQPDWWRAMGMPFQQHTIWESVHSGRDKVCVLVHVSLHICLCRCVCVCVHVKREGWLAQAVKGKKVWLFEGGLILPRPASADLWACEGNLSFVTFHLFSPRHPFFPLSLSGIQLFPQVSRRFSRIREEGKRRGSSQEGAGFFLCLVKAMPTKNLSLSGYALVNIHSYA